MVKKRRKKTIEELFESDHYRAIIYLTLQYHTVGHKNALRQLHYRWALIKNHDGINQPVFVRQMKTYFGKSLEKGGYRDYWIKENCVTSNSNLSNFLKKLVNDYHILEKYYDEGVATYRLTDKGRTEVHRFFIIKNLREMDGEQVKKWATVIVTDSLDKKFERGKYKKLGLNGNGHGLV